MDDHERARSAVTTFAGRAEHFTDLVEEREHFESDEDLRSLAIAIAEVYAASLELPEADLADVSVDEGDGIDPKPPSGIAVRPTDHYWEVFDPLAPEPDDPTVGSLSDDVADIYRDLMEGLEHYRLGRVEEAVWTWRFQREIHWGNHAVDALRALQRLLDGRDRSESP
mgnify:CR=1 FL=1